MLEQGEGHVVNTASEAGLTSSPMLGPYHATKYAVVGLSESLAMELEGTPVGVYLPVPRARGHQDLRGDPQCPRGPGPARAPADPDRPDRGGMGTVALHPADLAADVVYAVRADQLLGPHPPVTRARVHARNRRLEQGKNPKFGHGA